MSEEKEPDNEKEAVDNFHKQIDAFHKHLDECKHCDENPFNLCSTGKPLFDIAGKAALQLSTNRFLRELECFRVSRRNLIPDEEETIK